MATFGLTTNAHSFSEGLQNAIVSSDSAGFSSALFDVVTIQELFDRGDCVSVRFYNIIRDAEDGKGSVMAIGTNGPGLDGADINDVPGVDQPYVAYSQLIDDRILSENLNNENARMVCENMRRAGNLSYSATFSRSDLEAMMGVEGCTALELVPLDDRDGLSMTIRAVSIGDGEVNPLGTGTPYAFSCGNPCPPICGSVGNYINGR